MGTYPETGLKEARERREDARRIIDAGADPSAEKNKVAAAAKIASGSTFGVIAEEYLEKRQKAFCGRIEYLSRPVSIYDLHG